MRLRRRESCIWPRHSVHHPHRRQLSIAVSDGSVFLRQFSIASGDCNRSRAKCSPATRMHWPTPSASNSRSSLHSRSTLRARRKASAQPWRRKRIGAVARAGAA
jgi:hypothetical protein